MNILALFLYTASAALLCATLIVGRGQARPEPRPQPPAPLFRKTFRAEEAGEVRVRVRASAPGRDWGQAGRESAVVSVLIDGREDQSLVLYGGAAAHEYDLRVGPLSAGEHTVSLVAAGDDAPPRVESAAVTSPGGSEKDKLVWKFAPLLYGRDDNATTDTPLLLFYQFREAGETFVITYSVIWSNEDGGTGGDVGTLLARWGRTTDIEWVYEVTVDRATGALRAGTYQGANHRTLTFKGAYRGTHAILHTVTRNNMVGETGPNRLLFALAPAREYVPTRETREAVMDSRPWTHDIAAREMRREGRWEEPGDPSTARASDIRNYLNVDYQAAIPDGSLLAVAVQLKDGRVFFSDHGRPGDAIGRSGWVRTVVELPPGTAENGIVGLSFVRRDTRPEAATVAAGRAFLLDAEFKPRREFRRWSRPITVRPGAVAPAPGA